MSGNFVVPVNNLFIGQYYKSVNQITGSGSIAVTFDREQSWNNTGGYITHNSGSADFVVVQSGLYQVEFALTVAGNGATWTAGKTGSINIVRGVNNALLAQSANPLTNTAYTIQVAGTLYLLAGDIIRCVNNGVTTAGSVSVSGIANTFDFNTTFTWTFIR